MKLTKVTSETLTDPELQEKQLVWQYFQHRTDGFFVEVGANDPRAGSQTWLLEQNGWCGLLVEPQSALCEALRRERRRSQVFQVACSAPEKRGDAVLHIADLNGFSALEQQADTHGVSFVRTETVRLCTLDELLVEAGSPRVDFLSIDVEGMELDVLRGFSLKTHRPALLLVEDTVRSLEKHHYLTRHGYKLVKRTTLNNWYVPKECLFQLTTWIERIELSRKMFLGLPIRKLRMALRRQSSHKCGKLATPE